MRLVMLESAGIGFSEYPRVVDTLGITGAGWRNIRDGETPSGRTMNRVSRVLACDVHVLTSPDPTSVVTAPIPDWDWLELYGVTDGSWVDVVVYRMENGNGKAA